jgi:hypothetical protein
MVESEHMTSTRSRKRGALKLLFILGFMFWAGAAGVWMIYDASRPSMPNPQTGQVYALDTQRSAAPHINRSMCTRSTAVTLLEKP